ncbi:MAG: GntR family transcriptional regulator [Planctomycetes bacterium]|nr:GntR family transcriptional regulator [Planctomycetota bacterium]
MADTTTGHTAILPLAQNIGLRDSVAERLLVAVLDGSLQAGDRLVGQRLAAQLGVSATPVREALIELATLGFVELLPNRGAVCCEFGPTELRDIFQVRRLLEAEAAFGACGRVPVEQLQELRGRMLKLLETVETDPAWSDHAMAADHKLHKVIRQHCPNRRLAHEIERDNVLMRAIRRVAGNLYNVQLRAVSEHLLIIKALLAEDAELARKRMSKHVESTARGIAKVMFQQRGE